MMRNPDAVGSTSNGGKRIGRVKRSFEKSFEHSEDFQPTEEAS
jgi:hypothetical protein